MTQTTGSVSGGTTKTSGGYRIISFDGGPSAAALIRMLKRLEEDVPGTIGKTDVFAGTSDGAIMALYLAKNIRSGVTPEDNAYNLAVIEGAIQLTNDLVPTMNATVFGALRALSGWGPLKLSTPSLCGPGFGDVLYKHLGTTTFNQLSKGALAVSFNLTTMQAKIFRSFGDDTVDGDWPIADAAMCSGAFPILFQLHQSVVTKQRYIDGFVAAENPSMVAAANVFSYLVDDGTGEGPGVSEAHLQGVRLMSLGAIPSQSENVNSESGLFSTTLKALLGGVLGAESWLAQTHWGWMQWIVLRPFLAPTLALHSTVDVVNQQCRVILGRKGFFRFNAPMKEILDMALCFFMKEEKLAKVADIWAARAIHSDEYVALRTWVREAWTPDAPGRVAPPPDGTGSLDGLRPL